MNGTLGISVACSRSYMPLLRGWLESVRFFAPDVPICLMIHGEMDTKPLERRYDLQCIRQRDVKDRALRKTCWGFGTKVVAFWESPFEYVLHVDVDAVLWGDIRRNLPSGEWDIVHNEPHEVITKKVQNGQYFNPDLIFRYIEPFDWQACPFFQAGVICVRRGSLDLDEYIRMTELQRKYPDVFVNGDQGMLNILVFRAMKKGALKVEQAHLQTCVPVVPKEELHERFRFENGHPLPWTHPTVIHWAGPKPYKTNSNIFSEPMDYFRAIGMRRAGMPDWFPAEVAMRMDEFVYRDISQHKAGVKRAMKRLLGRKI